MSQRILNKLCKKCSKSGHDDIESVQISQKQRSHKRYAIINTMHSFGYQHTDFVVHELGSKLTRPFD